MAPPPPPSGSGGYPGYDTQYGAPAPPPTAAMMTPGPPPASGNSPYFFASNNPAGMMQGGGGYNPQEVVDPSTQYQQPNIMTPQPPAAMQQPQLPPAMMEPAAPGQQQTIQQAPPPPAPVEKAPIPAEHQVIQDVFDALRTKCVAAASHPQIKRKLEDVGKKLEVLYDKLRENSLPQPTLSGLHQITEFVWSFDYKSCLLVLNQMASAGSAFVLLSQFVPGIKVLIQVAMQLGVYIERR